MAATVSHMPSAARHAARAGRVAGSPPPATTGVTASVPSRIHFWRGRSGQRHLCSVYSLLDCPPLPKSVFLLVRRHADGRRERLAVGTVEHEHAPLNLAQVRQAGATAGANEVHVSFLARGRAARRELCGDLAMAKAVCA